MFKVGNRVEYLPTGELATVIKIDPVYEQVEIRYESDGVARVEDVKKLRLVESDKVSNKPKYNIGDNVKTNTEDEWNNKRGVIVGIFPNKYKQGIHEYDIDFGKEQSCFDENELELVAKNQSCDGKFTQIAIEAGKFTDMKNKQYGSSVDATYEIMKVLLERYTYDDEQYLIPKSLLSHLLLQVRVMDKVNRLFNNPSGKGDSESPWKDILGYSLIGVEMVERNEQSN